MKNTDRTGLEIAVIGMSACFPGARDIEQYWENLKNGVESISFFSDDELLEQGISAELLKKPNFIKAKPYIPEIQYFDADFFGYSHRETQILDIQMRLFHQIAYHGLENAGYNPDTYNGQIGLYAGASTDINWYAYLLSLGARSSAETFESSTLANKDMLSQLVSYKLNLKGPAQSIYTTCSTSLTAIHNASRALLLGECNIALAGGITVNLPLKSGYLYEEGMILSNDGHCRAFDNKASGTIFGDGVGVVVLKRLTDAIEDNDTIYAIIKSSACNNDGRRKVGLSAPSVEGQADVILTALELSKINPEHITYIEAHATGTNIGDPIEVAALKKVYNTSKRNYCALGSVKSNIGHLHAAAGVASFIKTVLQLHHKTLVPQINCDEINIKLGIEKSQFYINTELRDWENAEHPLCAGVSSFGIGGTNTHLILEEYKQVELEQEQIITPTQHFALLLSAKSEYALQSLIYKYKSLFEDHPDINLSDVCYTLNYGRKVMGYRAAFCLTSPSDYKMILDGTLENKYFCSNQEVQKKEVVLLLNLDPELNLTQLYDRYKSYPLFSKHVDECVTILTGIVGSIDISRLLLNKDNRLEFEDISKFILEYALAKTWIGTGISPTNMIGTGKSEWVSATIAGVLKLETAIYIVYYQAIETQKMETGAMLEIGLSADEIKPYLKSQINISIIKQNGYTTVSGKTNDINLLAASLGEKGTHTKIMSCKYPLYSIAMEPVVQKILPRFQNTRLNKKTIPFNSSASSKEHSDEEGNIAYLLSVISRQIDEKRIYNDEYNKKNTLIIYQGNNLSFNNASTASYAIKIPPSDENISLFIIKEFSNLWTMGVDINWNMVCGTNGKRIPLPSYPFENKKIWDFITGDRDYSKVKTNENKENKQYNPRPSLSNNYTAPQSETESILIELLEEMFDIRPIGVTDDIFELGGHSLLITQIVAKVKEIYQYDIELNEVFDIPTVQTLFNHLIASWGSLEQVEEVSQTYREYQRMMNTTLCI